MNTDSVKSPRSDHHLAKSLGHKSFSSKVIVRTHTDTYNRTSGPMATKAVGKIDVPVHDCVRIIRTRRRTAGESRDHRQINITITWPSVA